VSLGGEQDVDESGDRQDGTRVLGVVQEVALAGLIFGIPHENIEPGILGAAWAGRSMRGMRESEEGDVIRTAC
jgi:hypothetical protein